jgi:hypothetical protein
VRERHSHLTHTYMYVNILSFKVFFRQTEEAAVREREREKRSIFIYISEAKQKQKKSHP